ncbi:MAG: hypothetical protein ACXVMS_00330 [Flavisolibacter sp.]
MPQKLIMMVLVVLCIASPAAAQKPVREKPAVDTLFTDYDALFSEMDAFLDSLLAPRNFTLINIGLSTGYFDYKSSESYVLKSTRKLMYTPSISYFLKSGFGMSAAASIVDDGTQINPYQYSLSGSYDYIRNRKFVTGVMLTHFFTKDQLPFYTSPLQNGATTYFTYRNFWLKPSLSATYGWGSRSEYSQREDLITSIRLKPRGYTSINKQESINDFNLTFSVRHDFYWLDILTKGDFIRVTPQISFISGTQKFGLNQSSSSYATLRGTNVNILYNSENIYLDDKTVFQPISLSGFLKTEYSKGKFFIQPQVMFDYYFPAKDQNLSTVFSVNAGVIF